MRYTFYGLTVTTNDYRRYDVVNANGVFLGTIFKLFNDNDQIIGFSVDDGRIEDTLPAAVNLYNAG